MKPAAALRAKKTQQDMASPRAKGSSILMNILIFGGYFLGTHIRWAGKQKLIYRAGTKVCSKVVSECREIACAPINNSGNG